MLASNEAEDPDQHALGADPVSPDVPSRLARRVGFGNNRNEAKVEVHPARLDGRLDARQGPSPAEMSGGTGYHLPSRMSSGRPLGPRGGRQDALAPVTPRSGS